MITQQQLATVLGELPEQFSIGELVDRLVGLESRPTPEPKNPVPATPTPTDFDALPVRPDNLTPEQATDWDYYMSPEAIALYRRFPVSPEVRALRGIIKLSAEDQLKSNDELRYEAMKEKYGL